jgi:phosphatidylglycerophosphate synthase
MEPYNANHGGVVRTVQPGPVIGVLGQLAALAVLAAGVGLGARGWVVGGTVGLIANVLLAGSLARHGAGGLGPADRVTLTRATLVGCVAALVADSFSRPAHVTLLLVITVVALVLDAVDGRVARHTGTASALGARFDGEVDAFLILVLSSYVARSSGAWVLAIGLARYAFLVAGWPLPWLRATLPPRYWRKVVAVIQGVVLAVACAGVTAGAVTGVALAASLVLLTESFARDVWWLYATARPVPDDARQLEQARAA